MIAPPQAHVHARRNAIECLNHFALNYMFEDRSAGVGAVVVVAFVSRLVRFHDLCLCAFIESVCFSCIRKLNLQSTREPSTTKAAARLRGPKVPDLNII